MTYRSSDRSWERCMWLEEILARLPLDFVFTEDDLVVDLEFDIYVAFGCDPHQWQEFIWIDNDEWQLGDSDTGSYLYPRISELEFGFIHSELAQKEPMPISKLKVIRSWLEQ